MTRRIPLWVKLLYTAFLAVLVPFYWRSYGPVNFLWFCDIALLVTLPALWLESPFLSSLEAVAIAFPQLCWAVDFTAHLAGIHLLGLADYMFEPRIPLFVRGLSLFHGWLPFLLLWMVWQLGYDRRAFAVQTVVAIALLAVCFFFTPRPPHPTDNPNAAVNLNWVFGPGDEKVQTWMAPGLYLALQIVRRAGLSPADRPCGRWRPARRPALRRRPRSRTRPRSAPSGWCAPRSPIPTARGRWCAGRRTRDSTP